LSAEPTDARSLVLAEILARLRPRPARPFVVGICGAQGSGKSTLARGLLRGLGEAGVAAATLSIDDLYLTLAERERLAREVHPLLRTRGVPGTHDVTLGLAVIGDIDGRRPALLPRFDKSRDDRAPVDRWEALDGPLDVLLFEGWCVGARPQSADALVAPINALERDEDRGGHWRAYVNAALETRYRALFDRIDCLTLLAAPGFEVVRAWRIQQENDLRAQSAPGAPGVMTDEQIARFIQHYERLTRHILDEMPSRADITLTLDADRRVLARRRTAGRSGH
jgi:D-glycerate 3-kinase